MGALITSIAAYSFMKLAIATTCHMLIWIYSLNSLISHSHMICEGGGALDSSAPNTSRSKELEIGSKK